MPSEALDDLATPPGAAWPGRNGALRTHDAVQRLERPLEHVPVQKHEGGTGLGLCRGRHPLFDGQVRQEAGDLGLTQLVRMPLVVEQDEAADPAGEDFLRGGAVAARPRGGANLVQEPGRASGGRIWGGTAKEREKAWRS